MSTADLSLLSQSASGLNLMFIADVVRCGNKSLHSVNFPFASRWRTKISASGGHQDADIYLVTILSYDNELYTRHAETMVHT